MLTVAVSEVFLFNSDLSRHVSSSLPLYWKSVRTAINSACLTNSANETWFDESRCFVYDK